MKALLIVLLLFPMVAWAKSSTITGQFVCNEHDFVVKQFKDNLGEAPAARGITEDGWLFELLVSERGSWSVLLTQPDGTSCLVASGSDFEAEKVEIPGVPL